MPSSRQLPLRRIGRKFIHYHFVITLSLSASSQQSVSSLKSQVKQLNVFSQCSVRVSLELKRKDVSDKSYHFLSLLSLISAKRIAFVRDARLDTCSRNVFRHEDLAKVVQLGKNKQHFICEFLDQIRLERAFLGLDPFIFSQCRIDWSPESVGPRRRSLQSHGIQVPLSSQTNRSSYRLKFPENPFFLLSFSFEFIVIVFALFIPFFSIFYFENQ